MGYAAEKIVESLAQENVAGARRNEPVQLISDASAYRGPIANVESTVERAARRDRWVVSVLAGATFMAWAWLIYGFVTALQAPVYF